ncbi:MAG: RsmD family RNA methyltransferase, partial [Candidatus Omnitrophica bacterium]|nr:RsmD family RNA methyltransferase [Candidatus Omnitrophota bacterium]
MKIISGKYKGKVFVAPKGIRPTPQRLRKAIFDILGDISDFSFLELFAGSGAVSWEALSKGIKRSVLVESNPYCLRAIYQNIKVLDKDSSKVKVYPLDVEEAIMKLHKEKESFEIIFLDPPYLKGLVKKTLQRLTLYDILAPTGFIIVQHTK